MKRMKNILAVLENVVLEKAVAERGLELSRTFNANITFLLLIEPSPYSLDLIMMEMEPVKIALIIDGAEKKTVERIAVERENLRKLLQGSTDSLTSADSAPSGAIITHHEVTNSNDAERACVMADLIVIGRHRKDCSQTWLQLFKRLISRGKVPVVVIPN